MRLARSLRARMLRRLLPQPVPVRHAEYSMLFSAADDRAPSSPALLALAVDAIQRARALSLPQVTARMAEPPYYPEVWPGEFYRLLGGLIQARQPRRVVEIGTGVGPSTLVIKQFLPADGALLTFDLVGWRDGAAAAGPVRAHPVRRGAPDGAG